MSHIAVVMWRASISMPPEAGAQLEEIGEAGAQLEEIGEAGAQLEEIGEAGAQLEEMGKEMGVTAPVVARILLLEKLRERAIQDRQARAPVPRAHDWGSRVAEPTPPPYAAPSDEGE